MLRVGKLSPFKQYAYTLKQKSFGYCRKPQDYIYCPQKIFRKEESCEFVGLLRKQSIVACFLPRQDRYIV